MYITNSFAHSVSFDNMKFKKWIPSLECIHVLFQCMAWWVADSFEFWLLCKSPVFLPTVFLAFVAVCFWIYISDPLGDYFEDRWEWIFTLFFMFFQVDTSSIFSLPSHFLLFLWCPSSVCQPGSGLIVQDSYPASVFGEAESTSQKLHECFPSYSYVTIYSLYCHKKDSWNFNWGCISLVN